MKALKELKLGPAQAAGEMVHGTRDGERLALTAHADGRPVAEYRWPDGELYRRRQQPDACPTDDVAFIWHYDVVQPAKT